MCFFRIEVYFIQLKNRTVTGVNDSFILIRPHNVEIGSVGGEGFKTELQYIYTVVSP